MALFEAVKVRLDPTPRQARLLESHAGAARSGARLHVIDRWYPSSKACSSCGTVKAKLSLSERVFHCDTCGFEIDRDLNAAINLMVAGSAPETLNARGGDARRADTPCRATQTPVKREPSSHPPVA